MNHSLYHTFHTDIAVDSPHQTDQLNKLHGQNKSNMNTFSLLFSAEKLDLNVSIRVANKVSIKKNSNPAKNYMFKVSNKNTRTRCEICSKLAIKTPERQQWQRSSLFLIALKIFHTLF